MNRAKTAYKKIYKNSIIDRQFIPIEKYGSRLVELTAYDDGEIQIGSEDGETYTITVEDIEKAVAAYRWTNGDVWADVRNERIRQDQKNGGVEHDDNHFPAEWCELINAYATWAKTMESFDNLEKYRRRMIQVAALAIAAVESHDRLIGR
ncbi:hypothetical protein DSCO28_07550 [Desulfosarcina ovata subsp. sediminis]|uniref:Uncharacterized protein n=1 Tax=Desulfosarcina ovata subsp. sediminis TaxID=885957 RepID=A0A5K7ZKL5_9BACT|nr:hypothetical protein [Desulfosarcina ovata]BBO80189.1 hypothetical protein DSCO28_07550 [Desulfosarcina ovata subsp. sediminis]